MVTYKVIQGRDFSAWMSPYVDNIKDARKWAYKFLTQHQSRGDYPSASIEYIFLKDGVKMARTYAYAERRKDGSIFYEQFYGRDTRGYIRPDGSVVKGRY